MPFHGYNGFEKTESVRTKTIPYSPYTEELATNGARSVIESQIERKDEKTQKRTITIWNPFSKKDERFEHHLMRPIRGLTPLENMLMMLIENHMDSVKGHETDPEGLSIVTLQDVKTELNIPQSYDAKRLIINLCDYMARIRGTLLIEERNADGSTIGGMKWYPYYSPEFVYKNDANGQMVDSYIKVRFNRYLTDSMRSHNRIPVPFGVIRSIDLNAYPLMPQLFFFAGLQCRMNIERTNQGITVRSLLKECGITEADLKKNRHPIRGIKRLMNHLKEIRKQWKGFDFHVEGVPKGMDPDFKRYSDSLLDKKVFLTFPTGYVDSVIETLIRKGDTIGKAIKQSKKRKAKRSKADPAPKTNQPPREITADSLKF